jgi:hypothetical protein
MPEKFKVPTEMVELPSQGKVYPEGSELSKGVVEVSYMTAKQEDILTNINLLRQGVALERMLQSLIVSPISYEDLLLGDRNALLIAARILAYGGEYSFDYRANSEGAEPETIKYDLSLLDHKKIDYDLSLKLNSKNEFEFELPHTKNVVTFKLLTVADDRKIDEEIKGVKKATGVEPGALSMRLKHQITSVNGEYSTKAVRDFIDGGYLLSKDSLELRRYIGSITPDIDTKISFTTKEGQEVTMDLPMEAQFFFPG